MFLHFSSIKVLLTEPWCFGRTPSALLLINNCQMLNYQEKNSFVLNLWLILRSKQDCLQTPHYCSVYCPPTQACSQPTKIGLCWQLNYSWVCLFFLIIAIAPPVRIATLTKANHILEEGLECGQPLVPAPLARWKHGVMSRDFPTKIHLVPSWHRGLDVTHQIVIKFHHCSSFPLPISNHSCQEFIQ